MRARLVTSNRTHAFVLFFERDGAVAVKDGFSSGYRGEGPRALADALCLLELARIEVKEVEVPEGMIGRLASSALTHEDLERIEIEQPVRPMRWHDYVYAVYQGKDPGAAMWGAFDPTIPFGALDPRLKSLALLLHNDPDKVLIDGFRLLEDRIRERTRLVEHGAKLFSLAFAGDEPVLAWFRKASTDRGEQIPIDRGEQAGRAQLFTGAYQAFRNPRAHRTQSDNIAKAVAEFMLLNQLFLLEAEAKEHTPAQSSGEVGGRH